jgi:glucose-1-phosphatase
LFWGDLSGHSAAFDRELKKELAALGGSEALTRRLSPGIEAAAIALDNPAVENDELQVTVKEGLHLGGSIRPLMTACDALSLQYYELGDSRASFGHELSFRQWQDIAAVKEAGIHVYRRMPTFARALARPLLEVFLQELNAPGRKFTFLCGHDTNVATVMGALGVRENSLPESIEQEVPIGGKLVVERWQDRAGESFLALKLVYPSVYQLCSELPIDMRHPPQSLPLHLQGMEPNEEDLIPLQAFRQRLTEAIESDEELMDVDGK